MSKSNPSRKPRSRTSGESTANRVPRASASAGSPATVSPRWLITGFAIAIAAALLCAWATLCILFWQGSWQLLYHPASAVARTPASANLAYESVGFGTNAAGEPQLRGWWIPASSPAHYTAVYLHGARGNLGDTLGDLVQLHNADLNLFAFDYRGYGQSRFMHPSEQRLLADAESALDYLTRTRHIPAASIIVIGKELGANLGAEVGAKHADLAGVVLDEPIQSPTKIIFNDPRAHLVPAHLLVSDKWDTSAAAADLLIPSLWFYASGTRGPEAEAAPAAYSKVPARKMLVWLTNSPDEERQFQTALKSWLDQLASSSR